MINFHFKIKDKTIFVVDQIEFFEICYTIGYVRDIKDIFVIYSSNSRIKRKPCLNLLF